MNIQKSLLSENLRCCRKAFTTTVEQAQELAAIAKKKVETAVFKTSLGQRFQNRPKNYFRLGDIVEAEFHFDRY
jgi:hypothetical protein